MFGVFQIPRGLCTWHGLCYYAPALFEIRFKQITTAKNEHIYKKLPPANRLTPHPHSSHRLPTHTPQLDSLPQLPTLALPHCPKTQESGSGSEVGDGAMAAKRKNTLPSTAPEEEVAGNQVPPGSEAAGAHAAPEGANAAGEKEADTVVNPTALSHARRGEGGASVLSDLGVNFIRLGPQFYSLWASVSSLFYISIIGSITLGLQCKSISGIGFITFGHPFY